MTEAWLPVLDGRLARAAREAIHAVAESLGHTEIAPRYIPDLALFWAYYCGLDESRPACSTHHYERATERLVALSGARFGRLGLHGGLAGRGWVLQHISEEPSPLLDKIDQILCQSLEGGVWTQDYDLIEGLVGFGTYFLERLTASPTAELPQIGLRHIVDHLDATRVEVDEGVTWRSPSTTHGDQGSFNCGIAHGVPGVVGFLGRLSCLPLLPSRAHDLLKGASRWLENMALDRTDGCYPNQILSDGTRDRARTAWCYGDPGVAVGLWRATLCADASISRVQDLAKAALRRPLEVTLVRDAAFCHGAAGLAHLCNRFYQATRDEAFRDTAQTWFDRLLGMRRPGAGVGGFLSYMPRDGGDTYEWLAMPGLVEGAVGIGLTLLAAIEPIEPLWDRMLLCDIPPLCTDVSRQDA